MLPRLFKKQTYEPFLQPKPEPRDAPVAARVPRDAAPGTAITHKPELLAHFRGQHVWLQKTLEVIETDAMAGDFGYAQRALKSFRRTLTTHLLEEHVKVYTYVAKCVGDDDGAKCSMLALKSEMDAAATTAMRFANTYAQTPPTPFNQQQFLTELEAVRTALADRIDWEEGSLYGLYLPPQAYA